MEAPDVLFPGRFDPVGPPGTPGVLTASAVAERWCQPGEVGRRVYHGPDFGLDLAESGRRASTARNRCRFHHGSGVSRGFQPADLLRRCSASLWRTLLVGIGYVLRYPRQFHGPRLLRRGLRVDRASDLE